jgi:hypothetical protein
LSNQFPTEAETTAYLRIMRVALALDQYAQDQGAFPETLAALVPEFLDAVPEDPQTGAPLTYRHEAEGCTVYAFGDNGVDDGGAIDPSGSVRGLSGDIAMRLPLMLE